ncbi:MAG: hypothetical protein KAR79_00665, partial [Simkaniaceae bacterium]|nr:hypothetical protein [Simkaniaceae bacterium]
IENISGRDCVIIVHEAEDDAHARRKSFSSSTHPFDLWFGEQLKMYYEKFPEPAHLLFKFDASH